MNRHPATPLALFCAAFIVYGSLFPFAFDWVAKSPATIFDEWNPFDKRADAVDNVLLFVPLGAALFFASRSPLRRLAAALGCWLVLGLGLQLAQLYLPSRVASMADAINNGVGLLLGLMLAAASAPWLRRSSSAGRGRDPMALLLVGAWYLYESFPLLPTLDVGLLAAHIKPVLAGLAFEPLRLLRHGLAAALGALALLAARPVPSRVACLAVGAAVLLVSELLVAYGDLRLEALFGIVAGMLLGERLDRTPGSRRRGAVLALAAAALVMTVVTPFRAPISAPGFTFTPFSHLLWHGTTVGVPTAAFEALAIGALLWAGAPLGREPWHAVVAVGVVVMGLEAVRSLLGTGPADTSTLVIALLMAPFAMVAARRQRQEPAARSPRHATPVRPVTPVASLVPVAPVAPAMPAATQESAAGAWVTIALQAAIALVLVTLGLVLLLKLPGMPYNVLELFAAPGPLPLVAFAAALLWLGAGPWVVAAVAAGRRAAPLWLPAMLALAAMTSLLLLRLSVTQESLDDITGSTDLYRRVTADVLWGEAWRDRVAGIPAGAFGMVERGVRFTALYSLLLVPLAMASICVDRRWPLRRALPAIGVLALCGWLAKWLVVDAAITDNLTELIARSGLPWLAALAMVFSLHVTFASGRVTLRRAVLLIVATLVVVPLGWWLLKHGLEQVVLKYGTVFSAQQFLLGRNRAASLSDSQLFVRWSVLYLAMFGLCALGMGLARRASTWLSGRDGHAMPAAAGRRGLRHEH